MTPPNRFPIGSSALRYRSNTVLSDISGMRGCIFVFFNTPSAFASTQQSPPCPRLMIRNSEIPVPTRLDLVSLPFLWHLCLHLLLDLHWILTGRKLPPHFDFVSRSYSRRSKVLKMSRKRKRSENENTKRATLNLVRRYLISCSCGLQTLLIEPQRPRKASPPAPHTHPHPQPPKAQKPTASISQPHSKVCVFVSTGLHDILKTLPAPYWSRFQCSPALSTTPTPNPNTTTTNTWTE